MRHELTNNRVTRREHHLRHFFPWSPPPIDQSRHGDHRQLPYPNVGKHRGVDNCGLTQHLDVAALESKRHRVVTS